jgi:hypothetical protein
MAYIGKVPSAVPITSADLADKTYQQHYRNSNRTQDATTFLRGDNSFAEAGGGKVLQVIQTVKSDTFSHTGTTFTKHLHKLNYQH